MLSRFLLSTLVLLLFLGASAVPAYFMVKTVPEENMGMAILALFVVVAALMLPLMDWCAKHIFYFAAEGQAVAEADLRKEILSINDYGVPIVATENGDTIEITWNYQDEQWQALMASRGITEWFKVTLRFDPSRHVVTMLDTYGRFSRGYRREIVRWSRFRGIYLNYSIRTSATIRLSYRGRKDFENMLDTESIHNPVMNTILGSGWNVRFAIL